MGAKKLNERGYMPQADRPKGGREPLGVPGERTVQIGIKMPASLEQKFVALVQHLKSKGYKTTKSHLIRELAVYMMDCAEDVFIEKAKANDAAHDTNGEAQI